MNVPWLSYIIMSWNTHGISDILSHGDFASRSRGWPKRPRFHSLIWEWINVRLTNVCILPLHPPPQGPRPIAIHPLHHHTTLLTWSTLVDCLWPGDNLLNVWSGHLDHPLGRFSYYIFGNVVHFSPKECFFSVCQNVTASYCRRQYCLPVLTIIRSRRVFYKVAYLLRISTARSGQYIVYICME
jgi:hypothetical protein